MVFPASNLYTFWGSFSTKGRRGWARIHIRVTWLVSQRFSIKNISCSVILLPKLWQICLLSNLVDALVDIYKINDKNCVYENKNKVMKVETNPITIKLSTEATNSFKEVHNLYENTTQENTNSNFISGKIINLAHH